MSSVYDLQSLSVGGVKDQICLAGIRDQEIVRAFVQIVLTEHKEKEIVDRPHIQIRCICQGFSFLNVWHVPHQRDSPNVFVHTWYDIVARFPTEKTTYSDAYQKYNYPMAQDIFDHTVQ